MLNLKRLELNEQPTKYFFLFTSHIHLNNEESFALQTYEIESTGIRLHKNCGGMVHTCDSVNLTFWDPERPARSCSMYSNTRYKLHETLEVTRPSNFMTFG